METQHSVVNSDCLAYLTQCPDNWVPMILADIPYEEVSRPDSGLRSLDKGDGNTKTFDVEAFCIECCRVSSGSVYIFCGTEQLSSLRHTMVACGLSTRVCVWEKTNPSPMNGEHLWLSGIELCAFGRKAKATFNRRCTNTVFKHPVARKRNNHPTTKPVSLFRELIEASTNPGDTVLDPCAGSGTTLLAALECGRNSISVDISKKYCTDMEKMLKGAENEPH